MMTGTKHTTALFVAIAQLWASYSASRAKGKVSVWGWIKFAFGNRKALAALRGIGAMKEEFFDLTAEEMDELREVTLSAAGWNPTEHDKNVFAAIYLTVRDCVTNLLRLKNTVQPPRAEIVP